MRKYGVLSLVHVYLSSLICLSCFADGLQEDFSDSNYTDNPSWRVLSGEFEITGPEKALKIKTSLGKITANLDSGISDVSWLSISYRIMSIGDGGNNVVFALVDDKGCGLAVLHDINPGRGVNQVTIGSTDDGLVDISLSDPVMLVNVSSDLVCKAAKNTWYDVYVKIDVKTGRLDVKINGIDAGEIKKIKPDLLPSVISSLLVRGRYPGGSIDNIKISSGEGISPSGDKGPTVMLDAGVSTTEKKMSAAWETLRNRMFCEKTSMIYDSVSKMDGGDRFDHLPFPEEIKADLPNSLGWGTGMEDCMINAGMAIDACILRSQVRPDDREVCREFAQKIFKGMDACASIHGVDGYVVRGISPWDNSSSYVESSRDQYTFWVFGLWRYYNSQLVSDLEKSRIAILIDSMARLCEQRVVKSKGYSIGKINGDWSGINKMLGVGSHEALRLPMFYLAAWSITGNQHWHDQYTALIEKALSESEGVRQRKPLNDYEASQMQISLLICYKLDADPIRHGQISSLLDFLSRQSEQQFLSYYAPRLGGYNGPWNALAEPWRMSKSISIMGAKGDVAVNANGRKLSLLPVSEEGFKEAFSRLRGFGNMSIAVFLDPGRDVSSGMADVFYKVITGPEYHECTTAAVANVVYAYWLIESRSGHR